MSSPDDVAALATSPLPIPVIDVESGPSTPPDNEEKAVHVDMGVYLENLRKSHEIPIYAHALDAQESVMCALVPPRLEEVFCDHRFRGGRFRFYPHALLVRDCMPAQSIEKMTWWRDFWSEEEVMAAVSRRDSIASYACVDDAHEHNNVIPVNVGRGGCHWRGCDMADSFNRGRLAQRHYDLWIWWPFYRNPHDFPTLGCLVNVVRIKQLLWRRYCLFFSATTISEVYPENEIASWVWAAYQRDEIAVLPYRDEELSYEVRTKYFADKWPKKIRTYEEELVVQRHRQEWLNQDGKIRCGQVPYLPEITRRIFNGEESPKCLREEDDWRLAKEASFWKQRRNPIMEQHDAGEPNLERWRAKVKEVEEAVKATITTVRSDDDFSDTGVDDEELLIY